MNGLWFLLMAFDNDKLVVGDCVLFVSLAIGNYSTH